MKASHEGQIYFSNIFMHSEKDASHRMKINPKKSNTSAEAPRFIKWNRSKMLLT